MKSGGFFKKFGVCALSAALCVSAFSACGETDGKGDKIDGNTDIAAVKSEQVKDEAAWKAAFDVSKFTNFSMKEEDKSTQADVTQEGRLVYKFAGDKAYYSTYQKKSADENEQHDIFFAKTNEVWAAYGINYKNGAQIIQKPFSVGARIEHPQKLIDKAQYGAFAGHPKLGAADYKLSCHGLHQRGAYTFCMCPGGTVVAAASEKGGVIVNGMSTLARDGENANSALLVGIDPVDFPSEHPLAGMYYQREIEQNAFALGGGDYRAPAQLVGDFLADRESRALGNVQPTCPTGVTLTNLRYCLPDKVRTTMQAAITEMDKRLHGFALPDAVLTAPETRSSSSVRILRDEFCQCNLRGVYPCGEGAGYAGGIVSAAVDGIKCAHAVLADEH